MPLLRHCPASRKRANFLWTVILPPFLYSLTSGSWAQVVPQPERQAPKTQGWSIFPGIQVGEIFTDNIGLAPAGKEKSDFVTEISPYIQINGRSPREKLDLNYRMQTFFYSQTKGGENIYHLLNANSNTELVKNLLYFDGAGYLSQQLISPTGQVFLGNFTQTGNRTDVRTYVLSPYLQHAFGTTATGQLRYSRSATSYTKVSQADSTGNSYSANLVSGPEFYRVNWGVYLSRQQVGYQRFPSVLLQSAITELGWRLGRTLRLNATAGYDKNKYVSLNPVNSGKRWSVGFTWSPGRQTMLTAAYGRRYYGNNYEFNLRHSSRHTAWNASYSINATTTNGMQQSNSVVGLINPSSQINNINFLFPTLQAEVYILKQAQVGVTRQLREGEATFSAYQLRREFQSSGQTNNSYGVRGALSWKLSARGKVSLDGQWARYSANRSVGRYDYLLGDVDYTHQLSQRVSTTLQYRRLVNINQGGGGYAEDVISGFLNVQL